MKRTASFILLISLFIPLIAQAKRSISFSLPYPLGSTEIGDRMRSMGKRVDIQLLAANYTGLSSLDTPTLYWYASSTSPYSVELTVRQDNNKPLLKKNIGLIKNAGIQSIRLADHGVKLIEGENYTWSIAIIMTNSNQNSTNLVAEADVRYQKTDTSLPSIMQMITAGYWYDAVAELVETKSPQLQDILVQEGIAIE